MTGNPALAAMLQRWSNRDVTKRTDEQALELLLVEYEHIIRRQMVTDLHAAAKEAYTWDRSGRIVHGLNLAVNTVRGHRRRSPSGKASSRKRKSLSRHALYVKYGGVCQVCMQEIPYAQATRGHIIAISLGGLTEEDNLQLECWTCNNKKGSGMDGLPEWTAVLDPRDLKYLVNRSARAKTELERAEIWQHWAMEARSELYQTVRRVFAGGRLERKTIHPPELAVADRRIRDGWAQDRRGGTATWGELYASLQIMRLEEWTETVRAFEANPNNFYNAWWFIMNHPAFWDFGDDDGVADPKLRLHEKNLNTRRGGWHLPESFDVMVTKVDPLTGQQEDDGSLNTQMQVWVEMGKRSWPGDDHGEPLSQGQLYPRDANYHDYELDCGGDTFEEAIITAAVIIHTAYGNDREICDEPYKPENTDGE